MSSFPLVLRLPLILVVQCIKPFNALVLKSFYRTSRRGRGSTWLQSSTVVRVLLPCFAVNSSSRVVQYARQQWHNSCPAQEHTLHQFISTYIDMRFSYFVPTRSRTCEYYYTNCLLVVSSTLAVGTQSSQCSACCSAALTHVVNRVLISF